MYVYVSMYVYTIFQKKNTLLNQRNYVFETRSTINDLFGVPGGGWHVPGAQAHWLGTIALVDPVR